jgi:UDP-N-acetylglucosamine--N-acetylmuramyl-(pentapeptide) pyrophosphoryl-undecaprenol N-acetylglucosamine transferase
LRTRGKIFIAYEDTALAFPRAFRSGGVVSGNPVRACFRTADAAKGRAFLGVDAGARVLLVLGGSQGAAEINELVRAALPELTEYYTVVHQTGPNRGWDLKESEKYKPYPYINNEMPDVMTSAEIIMGRSGAGIWEWAVCGKPMVLIPLRGSGTRGDQVENAEYFEKAGAAMVLTGEDANPRAVADAVKLLALDNGKREQMAECSLKVGERDGTGNIARVLARQVNEVEK